MSNKEELISKLDSIMEQLMTTEEASIVWGLSQDRIKHLCSAGDVVAIKRGKTWLLLKDQDNPKQRERK
jgi:uncharacterized protein with PhoU and TrkA domain